MILRQVVSEVHGRRTLGYDAQRRTHDVSLACAVLPVINEIEVET